MDLGHQDWPVACGLRYHRLRGNRYTPICGVAILSLCLHSPLALSQASPSVSVSSPANGQIVKAIIPVAAAVQGSSTVAGVQFRLDGQNFGSEATSPYSLSWNTAASANGSHTLAAIAKDAAGNIVGSSSPITVTVQNPVDTTPVGISSVFAVNISPTSARIAWLTKKLSDSQVNFGPSSSYGLTSSLASSQVTTHSIDLAGLASSTTYHYQVVSNDQAGNISHLGDFTFTTPGIPSSPLGWTDLPGTLLQSVCPADYFGGQAYPFNFNCKGVIDAWSGGIDDPARNRLIIWGGGHNNYSGNEIYSLNLNSNPASLTRLTNPSPFNSDVSVCPAALADGLPNARETFNLLVRIEHADGSGERSGRDDQLLWTDVWCCGI
jgi:hypothetical protein